MAAFRRRSRIQSPDQETNPSDFTDLRAFNARKLDILYINPSAVGKNVYSYILDQSEALKGPCDTLKSVEKKVDKVQGMYRINTTIGQQPIEMTVKVVNSWNHSRFTEEDPFKTKKLKESIEAGRINAQDCLTQIKIPDSYLGLDAFANEVIIGTIVDQFARTDGFPQLYHPVIAGLKCGSKKVILSPSFYGTLLQVGTVGVVQDQFGREKFRDLIVNPKLGKQGSQVMVKPEITLGVIQQVTSLISFLQKKLLFVHADLRINNILYHDRPYRGRIGNFQIDCPITVSVSGFANSSLTITRTRSSPQDPIQEVRIFNEAKGSNYLLKYTDSYSFKSERHSFCVHTGENNSECGEANWWQLPSQLDWRLVLWTGHSGLPFYKSYDLYIFLVSMLMTPQYYYSIVTTKSGERLFNLMWLDTERKKIIKRLTDAHRKEVKLSTIFGILEGISIRCDLLEMIEKYLSSVQL